jgi:hypothetical protein
VGLSFEKQRDFSGSCFSRENYVDDWRELVLTNEEMHEEEKRNLRFLVIAHS